MVLGHLRRAAARLGYGISRLAPLFRRGAPLGVNVAVLREGRVLVVRHTYRAGEGLPGGRVRRGESAEAAAVRELAEEVGIRVAPERLESVYASLWLRIFELRPASDPTLSIDRGEIRSAAFLAPEEIREPDDALAAWLLCRRHALGPSGS